MLPERKKTTRRPAKAKQAAKPQHLIMPCDPLVNIRQGQIRAHYKVSAEVVGIGAFGAVRYCTHRKTKKEFAVKSIPQDVAAKNTGLLRNEVSILQQVKHKNVVRLVDLMQDERFIHIIMEKCQGGDLFDKIIKDGITFSEKMVSQIIRNILDAVDYLHERNICHRDLKVSALNVGWVFSAYHSSSYI
jgi:calcium-dependent protein kinase